MSLSPAVSPRWPHDPSCAHELRGRLVCLAGRPTDAPTRLRHQIATAIADHCGHNPLRSHRLAWGWSVREAVAAVHAMCRAEGRTCALAERLWEKWEKGARPGSYYQDLLARLFRTRPDRLGLTADYTDYDVGADVLPDGLSMPIISDPIPGLSEWTTPMPVDESHQSDGTPTGREPDNDITRSARESAYYHTNLSNIGPAEVDLLRDEVAQVARMFANAPRLAVFTRTRALRDHTFALLDRRLRAEEFTDLYVLAAATCGMLAEITHNLGHQAEAMAHARTGFVCADQAGHEGLLAWILGEQSVISYYDGRPAQAASLARRAQMHNTTDSARAWLPALEARAAAALGDTETARHALSRVGSAREQVESDDLDDLGGIFGCILPRQHNITAEAKLRIGDGAAAVADARACIAGYQDVPEQARAYDVEASAQINLALAHLTDGELDAAREVAQSAFATASQMPTYSVDHLFRRLHRRLTAPAIRESATALELRDQIEDLLASRTSGLPSA